MKTPAPATSAPYLFHAFEVSYFSAKVRPALRYKRLWFEERRADLGEIQSRTGLAFIPIVITPDDETWQDSSEIYDRLEERHPDPPLFPPTPAQRIAASLIELYVDEFATLPAMYYRWGSELGERTARARFAAMIGSAEMAAFAADRMVKAAAMLGVSSASAPAIEAHTTDLLAALSAHFRESAYVLGDHLSFADCALAGPIFGHFMNDLVSRRLLLDTAVAVVGWLERTNVPNALQQGNWPAADALAPSLVEVLRVTGRDAAPVIVEMIGVIERWADDAPDDAKIPRSVGMIETTLRGAPLTRAVFPYTLWMVQRTLDIWRALTDSERTVVLAWIGGTGWERVLELEPRHRMRKAGFELALDRSEGGRS